MGICYMVSTQYCNLNTYQIKLFWEISIRSGAAVFERKKPLFRTKRNDFPVGLSPPTPDIYIYVHIMTYSTHVHKHVWICILLYYLFFTACWLPIDCVCPWHETSPCHGATLGSHEPASKAQGCMAQARVSSRNPQGLGPALIGKPRILIGKSI